MALVLFGRCVKLAGCGAAAVDCRPGPVTAVTLTAGMRRPHAGAWIALGHGVIEFPLMILIMLGMGRLFEIEGVKIGIGLVGGVFLAWMGVGMLLSLRKADDPAGVNEQRHPFKTGAILTGSNPYFFLWWATVGLTLATGASEFGVLVFGVFMVVHWVCDLAWLEALSLASFRGTKLLGERIRPIVMLVCGAVLLAFAGMFAWDAAAKALAALRS